jgi:hypothetical protein
MAGYIGKSQGVTQVDGYNRSEADAEFVQVTGDTMTGALAVNGNLTVDTNTLFVDAANNNVGIGVSPAAGRALHLNTASLNTILHMTNSTTGTAASDGFSVICQETTNDVILTQRESANLIFRTADTDRARIDSSGRIFVGTTSTDLCNGNTVGIGLGTTQNGTAATGTSQFSASGNAGVNINRKSDDGSLVNFYQDGSLEGTISVSGTAVSYNGGHLARWSQTADNTRIDGLFKGTVLTNLDQMAVWSHETTYWAEGDDLPEGVAVGDVRREAYVEENEQLNCMAVSSVEGDPNVAGVFVNWDNDDNEYTADMNIAMTGDMIIRIAQGTTVQRGDLLMSAGDGTAKPQGDDIVRSKTIAKVTSTHVTCIYEDGSYCVPCVLMAC